ncbi:hypothetical protein BLNAU_2102 [Blattamonas nauphoetae]|uniref:Right handed beta helix domain-containing protein n=1 Tax=Blattamonas nauphoetae TaxID=2049346 RepID=A0ABQ9YHL1_9EUKA|nr:hypothetical protein BLNAU_2102 [Blattamonas nauphoetae]
MNTQLLLLLTCVSVSSDSSISPHRLSSVLNSNSNFSHSEQNEKLSISLPEGTYIGDNIEIAHRWMELTGEPSLENGELKTALIASSKSDVNRNTDDGRSQEFGTCMFSLTNSTLSMKWMHFSLIDNSAEERQEMNEARSLRLAVVSSSMLTISSSRIEVSPWTSAIVISGSPLEESGRESSVVISKSLLWNEVGSMCGVVETSSFQSIGRSVSVSIVGCSFDSSRILGNDGIGLSLTRAPRKNVESVGRMSSSLIGCSFVNMSSIGSSHSPRLRHLNQKMLGCVVSLTSSHLSGSTIRDVNTVGCVLCSNSSFSSLLPSPNTDTDSSQGTATSPIDSSEEPFDPSKVYSFAGGSGDTSSQAIFTNCHFIGANYPSARPLIFDSYQGTISIESCSFDNIACTGQSGGALYVVVSDQFNRPNLNVTSSNFTSCSSDKFGGAMWIGVVDDVLIESCRFEGCSTVESASDGGGIYLSGSYMIEHIVGKKVELVGCEFENCKAATTGGGVCVSGQVDLSVDNTKFERCQFITGGLYTIGGGIGVNGPAALTVKGSQFIECSSRNAGSAISFIHQKELSISDTLVKGCYSGTTGAICIIRTDDAEHLSFSHVLFDGNEVGDDTSLFPMIIALPENTPKFTDVAIYSIVFTVYPTLKFNDSFTTVSPDSSGMIIGRDIDLSTYQYIPERHLDPEFNKIGPLLTAKPTTKMNEKTGKIELEMEGKTPLPSQEYEVTVKEDETGTDTRFRMLFSDGTGTLVSGSDVNMKHSTTYTITKIVGVVSDSSSSRMTNDIEVPVAAWIFNLAATPEFISFTPTEPTITPPDTPSFSTLQAANARLVESDPQSAYVILLFDKDVCGSYDFVVEEEGKEVTLTINTEVASTSAGTKDFKVIGKGKLLTHNTTYTILSLSPTPNTDAPTDVRMDKIVTFHIPYSSSGNKSQLPPETKALLSWLIPLVACLLVALVLAIIIIFLLRRRQKKNAVPAQTEMEAQDQVEYEEKIEVVADNHTGGVLNTDGRSHSAFDSSNSNQPTLNPLGHEGKSMSMTNGDLVEVIACSGEFEVSLVGTSTTLYSVLHKEKKELPKRMIGLQIVNGLKAVLANRQASDVLTRLSSHWILLDPLGHVQLKLQMNAAEAEQEAAQTTQPATSDAIGTLPTVPKDVKQAGMDGLRWRAPEVVAGGGSAVDGQKAYLNQLDTILPDTTT